MNPSAVFSDKVGFPHAKACANAQIVGLKNR